jgi:proline iminopeptidase
MRRARSLSGGHRGVASGGLICRKKGFSHMKPILILMLGMFTNFGGISDSIAATESQVAVQGVQLYAREVGSGRPILVLHGGPDFDHRYLLPELDRLADSYRLIYYDQRGRGLSAAGVRPEDVTLASDIADVDAVRRHFRLDRVVLLGHSWGTVLALEYALRYPQQVSQLILLNPAPASTADLALFREVYVKKLGPDLDRQRQIVATAAYKEGDPETVAARYRLHFKPALMRTQDYETLMARMKAAFLSQGKEGILEAQAVEDRLMQDSWDQANYDLMPRLKSLRIPTLVIWGDHDFIPVPISEHIVKALPDAQLTILKGCGHFTFLECPRDVRTHIDAFLR